MSIDEITPSRVEVLPATVEVEKAIEGLRTFIPVEVDDGDEECTQSDLNIINNALAMNDAALRTTRTINGLVSLSMAAVKLIEARRKAKKLAYGAPTSNQGRVFEVLP